MLNPIIKDTSSKDHSETTAKAKDKVQSRFLLDVVVCQGPSIFKLLPCKDQPLLVWGDSFLILDLGLHIINSVRAFNFQSYGLSCQCLHKNLHPTTKTKNQMEGRLLLNVVVCKCPAILKLLTRENQPLLVWRDTFLVLDFGLDIVNSVGALNFQGDSFPGKSLHKNLHTTTKTKHQVEGGFLLNVVISESAAIFKLLTGKDQPLLVWGNTLLVLDLSLDIVNESSQIFAYHHEDEAPNGGWIPFGCCSQPGCGHLLVAYQQRSTSADLAEYPPCPGS
ncbi:Glucose-repressible alcohol dehydrogenase transcriptional effector CCR4 [Gossypium australe]|uniref:Glucose-repressible alcohol dehydrogenase transcriptional effector CCR4 n=1 Tax=Gossypium australe TaxID=47621 RepID=A0A5B6VEH1_9ROSI|nr:Glucose-repressible alcohol dehydrogenase transcriptional effector CCR4 [Gossypium australe]